MNDREGHSGSSEIALVNNNIHVSDLKLQRHLLGTISNILAYTFTCLRDLQIYRY